MSALLGGTQAVDAQQVLEDDVNTTETTGGRVAARWTPNDDWTLDISALYQETNADGFADANIEVGGLEQVRFAEEKLNEEWYQIGLTLQGNLGFADALVHTSYFNRDFRYDADGTDYQFAFNRLFDDAYYDAYNFGGDPQNGFAINDIESERWTVEARLSTPADSDSKWFGLVGLFYNRSKEDSLFASGNDSFAGSPGFYYIAYNLYFSNPVYVDYYGTVNPDFNPGSASLNGLPPDSWEGLNPSWPWNPTRRRQSKRLMT